MKKIWQVCKTGEVRKMLNVSYIRISWWPQERPSQLSRKPSCITMFTAASWDPSQYLPKDEKLPVAAPSWQQSHALILKFLFLSSLDLTNPTIPYPTGAESMLMSWCQYTFNFLLKQFCPNHISNTGLCPHIYKVSSRIPEWPETHYI